MLYVCVCELIIKFIHYVIMFDVASPGRCRDFYGFASIP